jgi:hypothetical protein
LVGLEDVGVEVYAALLEVVAARSLIEAEPERRK